MNKKNKEQELLDLFQKFLILLSKSKFNNLNEKENNLNLNLNLNNDNGYESKKQNILQLYKRVPKNVNECVNLFEIRRLGMSKLDMNAISYYYSGAGSEITLQRNFKKFEKILLNPKMLRDVTHTNTQTEIFDKKLDLPFGFAPTAIQKMAHEDGELGAARVAHENNVIYILSAMAGYSIEDVAKANKNGVRWFQVYNMRKKSEGTRKLIKKVEDNGFSGIVITIDAPIMGYRDRVFQTNFKRPKNVNFEIYKDMYKFALESKKEEEEKILKEKKLKEKDNINTNTNTKINEEKLNLSISKKSELARFSENLTIDLEWDSVIWMQSITKLPIILKGVMNPEDALKAAELEFDAIYVSNHGGRQLDTVPSTIEILYDISQALKKFYEKNPNKKKMEIYLDCGIRRGTDIFKALALGAKYVFCGRPVIWGLAADGENGVKKVVDSLKDELLVTMKLMGCRNVKEINEDCIYNLNSLKLKFAKF